MPHTTSYIQSHISNYTSEVEPVTSVNLNRSSHIRGCTIYNSKSSVLRNIQSQTASLRKLHTSSAETPMHAGTPSLKITTETQNDAVKMSNMIYRHVHGSSRVGDVNASQLQPLISTASKANSEDTHSNMSGQTSLNSNNEIPDNWNDLSDSELIELTEDQEVTGLTPDEIKGDSNSQEELNYLTPSPPQNSNETFIQEYKAASNPQYIMNNRLNTSGGRYLYTTDNAHSHGSSNSNEINSLTPGTIVEEVHVHQYRPPITRPPFPHPVSQNSPIQGLSNSILLRTCFRVGDAINAASNATKQHQTVIMELYARVKSSFRDSGGIKQRFEFIDIFHDRPPILNGIYSLWKGVELWDHDSAQFLDQGGEKKLCRVVGKLRKDSRGLLLEVLSIWEATWEDIDYVESIVHD